MVELAARRRLTPSADAPHRLTLPLFLIGWFSQESGVFESLAELRLRDSSRLDDGSMFPWSIAPHSPLPEPECSRLIGLHEVRPDLVTREEGGRRFCRDGG